MTVLFLADRSARIVVGRCIQNRKGWRFHPHTDARSPSRKHWPSANDCIPRWAHNIAKGACELLTLEEAVQAGLWKPTEIKTPPTETPRESV